MNKVCSGVGPLPLITGGGMNCGHHGLPYPQLASLDDDGVADQTGNWLLDIQHPGAAGLTRQVSSVRDLPTRLSIKRR
jgi:hypothetical protein